MAPRVPVYNQPVVQARPMPAPQLAYQNINVPAAAFDAGGAALAEGGRQLAQGADKMMSHALRMAEDDAKTAAGEALSAFQSSKRDMLFHKNDAYFRQTGRAAYDGYSALGPMLEEERQRMGANLSEAARRLYDQMSMRDVSGDMDSAARHAAAEREKWRDGVTVGLTDNAVAEAALYWSDPAKRDGALTAGRNAVLDRAAERGWEYDDPRLQAQLRGYDGKAAAAIVKRMAQDDPMAAKRYFDENQGKLSPEDYGTLSRLVEAQSRKHQIDQAYLGIVGAPRDIDARLMKVEGTGKNGRSSAEGYGQFTRDTWLDTVKRHAPDMADGKSDAQILAMRGDREFATRMVRSLRADNSKTLRGAGHDATPGNVYLAHFLGAGDAVKVLSAPDDAPIDTVVGSRSIAANPEVFAGIKNAGDMKRWAGDKMAGAVADSAATESRATVFEAQRTEALKIADPDIRDGVLSRLEHEYSVARTIDAQREREAKDRVLELVLTQKTDPTVVPVDLQKAAGPDFMNHMAQVWRQNGEARFDPDIENMLHEMSQRPDEFAQMDIGALYGTHDKSRVEYWQATQRAMNSRDMREQLKAQQRQPSYSLGVKVVDEMFPRAGKATDADKERNAKAKELVRNWVDGYHEDKGQAPKADDVYRYVRSLKLVEDAPFYRRDDQRIDALGTERSGAFPLRLGKDDLPDVSQATGVPAEILPQIADYLKSRRLPVTYENLIKTYNAGKKNG
jgi:hypothetical protein